MAILNHGSTIRTADGGQTTTTIVTATNIGSYGVALNSTYYIGTTQNIFNRASGAQTLTGVSIDGNAATATNGLTTGNYAGYSTFSGVVSSASGGFQTATYAAGRNRIWSFGNSDGYGLAYFQGSGGVGGYDVIGMHFGTATAAASQYQFNAIGSFTASGNVRAPIFYDSGNTAYYIDPASTSNLVGLTVANTITGSITGNAANVTGTVAIANGGTGATSAANARTNLGATTVGSNLFILTNPSAVTFLRVNADNTVSALDAATFRTAIGAGTGGGSVTSVGGTGTVSGLTLTGTVTTTGNLTLGGTLSVLPSNFASQTANTFLAAPNAAAGTPTFRSIVAADIPTLNQNTTGSSGSCTGNAATVTNGVYTTGDQTISGIKYFTSTVDPSTVPAGYAGGYILESTTGFGTYGIIFGSATGQHGAIGYSSNTMYFGTENGTDNTLNTKATLSSGGTFTANGDVRSPIFYDSDNTSYYINAAGASSLNTLTMAGIITTVSSGTAINFSGQSDSFGYNATAGQGTYIKGTGSTYIYGGGAFYDGSAIRTLLHSNNYSGYSTFSGSVTSTYGNFTTPGLIMGDAQYGFYVVSGNVYYKSASGGAHYWRNIANSANVVSFDNSGNILNTGYINASSYIYTATYFQTGGNLIYPSGYGATQRLEVSNSANNNWIDGLTLAPGGIVTAPYEMRSPIFYDSANTAYYLDPASTTNLNNLTVAGTMTFGTLAYVTESRRSKNSSNVDIETVTGLVSPSGPTFLEIRGFCPPAMYRTTGDRPAPYGIGFGNGSESGGIMPIGAGDNLQEIMLYGANSGPTTFTFKRQIWEGNAQDPNFSNYYGSSVFSINTGTGAVTASTDIRSPIYYDQNNTAYYIDAASTSVLNAFTGSHSGGSVNVTSVNGAYLGVNNTTNTNGYGISLYNGAVAGEPTYGLMFQGTATFGTHGSVTGDWATYFTMNNDNNRGWIFRKTGGGGNIASISGGGILTVAGDVRSTIFYDSNNTAYYVDPASTSSLNALTMAGTITGALDSTISFAGGACTAASYNYILSGANDGGNKLVIFVNGTTRTADGGVNALIIRNDGGAFILGQASYLTSILGSSVTINGNAALTSASTLTAGNLSGTIPSAVLGNSSLFVGTTSIALNRASASQTLTGVSIDGNSATTTLATKATRANGNFYIDDNFGNTVVGNYNAARLQGVFAMGDSYKLAADGTAVGTLYGLAWSHPNFGGVAANLADHGLLILQNGVFKGAWGGGSLRTPGDVRGTLFYDWDNTGYYCDPASTSNLNTITAAGNITAAQYYTGGWFRNNSSGNGLYNESSTQHFYSDDVSYWNVASSSSAQGIRLRTGGHAGTVRGYFYADTNNDVGLLNNAGSWRVRVVGGDYLLADGSSIRGQIFYDTNNTAYYIDAASTSNLNGLNVVDANLELYKSQTVDMSNTTTYSTSNYYPVLIGVPPEGCIIQIQNNLNSNVPSWSTHAAGFTLNLKWRTNGSGWGTTAVRRIIDQYYEQFTNQTICGGITQMTNSSIEVVWLRGGGQYLFKFSRNLSATAQATAYTLNSQTVTPTSTAQNTIWNSWSGGWTLYNNTTISDTQMQSPVYYDYNNTAYYIDAASTSNLLGLTVVNTITGNITGNAGTATILQTARNINGTSFNGSAAITTATWGTARTITIGSTGKSVDGSAAVAWSLAEIGAAATNQTMFIGTTSIAINRASASQTLTGTSIDGSSASCTGNAATATTTDNINGRAFYNRDSGNALAQDSYTNNGIGYVTSVSLFGQTDGGMYASAYSTSWIHQIYGDFRTGQIAIRGRNNGTWQSWRFVLDSSNYTSYSPSLTGTGASGSWGISVTGSSASCTGNSATATRTSGQSGYPHAGTGMWAFYNWGGNDGGTSAPSATTYTTGLSVGSNPGDQAYGFQIANNMWNTGLWTRNYNSTFGSWIRLLDSSNYVGYSAFTGNVDGTQFRDANDTSFYLDPAGTSNLNKFSTFTMSYNDMNPMHIQSPYVARYNGSSLYRNGTMGYGTTDCNVMFSNWGSGFIDSWTNPANAPGGSTHYVGLQGFHYNHQNNSQAYGFQMLCAGEADNRFFWRSAWPNLRSWVEMIHTGNIASQTVATAGSCTGNAATATTLQTARNIGGVSFNGSANIDLPGVNTAGNQNTSGNAATVTNGMYLSGDQNISGAKYFTSNKGATSTVGANNTYSLEAFSSDAGAAGMSFHRGGYYAVNMGLDPDNVLRIGGWSASANRWELDMSGNNWVASSFRAPIFYDSNNTAYYIDPASTSNLLGLTVTNTITGSITGNAGGSSASCTGNAATATTLQTARNINGTSFNGSAAITTATWGTARTITIGSTGKSVDGSANVSWTLAELGAAATNQTMFIGTTSIAINRTSASQSLTGVNIDGSSGSCTGNSATVTNGVYTTGSQTIAGSKTFSSDIIVNNNIVIGKGGGNIATNSTFGISALSANTTGNHNSAFGYYALKSNITGSLNCAFGERSLMSNTTGVNNNAFGYRALRNLTTGFSNSAFGTDALRYSTTGWYNCAFGEQALFNNLSGSSNCAFGLQTLRENTVSNNSAFGANALRYNITGTNNSAFGRLSLYKNLASNNSAFGVYAMQTNTTGVRNSAFGFRALQYNTIGACNVAAGAQSLQNNTTGNKNNAFGYQALYSNTFGGYNNAFGGYALYQLTTGTNNTAIGRNAGFNLTTGSNVTCIGNGSNPSSGTVSNQITLGDSSINSLRCATTSISSLSDLRDKADIEDINIGLSFIEKIRPVTFKWDKREWYTNGNKDGTKKDLIVQSGFIAQDLKKLQEEFGVDFLRLVYESNPEKLEATPANLLIPLIKAVQELNEKVKILENKVRILENR